MRAWTISATILLGVTACSTGRNSVSMARPECAGPWLATVSNNGLDDVEVFSSRRYSTHLGTVRPGTTEEYLTTEREVQAKSASGGPSYDNNMRGNGLPNKNIVIRVACADKA